MDANTLWLERIKGYLSEEILNKISFFELDYIGENIGHMKRVSVYAGLFAKYLEMDVEQVVEIERAAIFHDIGKLNIPQKILNKPSRLNKREYTVMKKHAEYGYELLCNLSSDPLFTTAADIAYEHHERYDGKGYPRGLAGKEIGVYGRIVTLSDVFDALGSDRIYRKAWDNQKIFRYIEKERGKHFDPVLVDILFEQKEIFTKKNMKFKEQK